MRSRWLVLGTALALSAVLSCEGRPPSSYPGIAPVGGPLPAPAASPPAALPPELGLACAGPGCAAAAGPDGAWFDPQAIPQLLHDPRLAPVAEALAASGPAEAARVLRAARATHEAALGPLELAEWSFQEGLLAEEADQLGVAVAAYERAAGAAPSVDGGGPLRPYALYAAGRLHARMGEPKKALARFDEIQEGVPIPVQVDRADALARLGEIGPAAGLYREYLRQPSRPRDWADVTLRFARALLRAPGAANAEEAARLALEVDLTSPGGRHSAAAQEIFSTAKSSLPHARQLALESPPPRELADRALSLARSSQSKRALVVADRAITLAGAAAAPPPAPSGAPPAGGAGGGAAPPPDDALCVALRARGHALDAIRRREESLAAYGEAIARCDQHAELPVVLYEAGRVALRAGRNDAAVPPFEALETRFAGHRLADDARLLRADALRSMGEGGRARALLLSMPDDFPEGDMVGDGLFQLALAHVEQGDWRAAIEPLRRGVALGPERVYERAGRFPYFLGRALAETGDVAGATAVWQALVREQPLTYYMALAYARLEESSPGAARAAAQAGVGAAPAGRFLVERTEALQTPGFARAIALARQGAEELAVIELDALGLRASTAPSEVAYASAFLLASAGSIQRSHAIFRASTMPVAGSAAPVVDWLDHYPSGKWRHVWEIAFPQPYRDIVAAESARSGVPVALIYAIMREESAFAPRVVSSANAYGLMQLIVPTAKQMAGPLGLPHDAESLKEPATNIALGTRFLANLRRRFPDNPALAIPGYNAGPGAPERWLRERPTDPFDLWVERIPYRETRLYTKRVLTSLVAYEVLYGVGFEAEAFRLPRLASERAAREAEATASR